VQGDAGRGQTRMHVSAAGRARELGTALLNGAVGDRYVITERGRSWWRHAC
jgi:hypothetical protein